MSWASKAIKKVKKSVGKVVGGSGLVSALTGGLAGGLLAGPAGALAGGALGLASGMGQDATNEANADAVKATNEANINLWREQAAYNTPANQVARLRAAGLNPNLFYSQGDTGNLSSAPTMKAAQYDYNYAQAVDKVATYYQMKNLAAQNANLQAQTDNINAQTRLRQVEGDYQKLQLDYFKKYGYFPNQSETSLIRQTAQDVFGKYSNYYSWDAFKEGLNGAFLKEGDLRHSVDLSPERIGKEKARALARKGWTYDRNARRWIRL